MGSCKCNIGLSNTGVPNCVPIASVTKKIIMVPYYDNDGNINSVDCTDTFNEAYFLGKVNESDTSKRWFPLPEVKNVEDVKADSIFESFNDGSNLFIQEGVRTFTGVMPNQTPELLGQIKDARCVRIGVFIIDKEGNLIGNGKADGLLYPILVDNQSWNPTLVKTTDTTVQKIQLSFEYSRIERDEDIRMILADELGGYDVLQLEGLKDVCIEDLVATASTDTLTFQANTIFGSKCTPVAVQGLGDPTLTEFVVTADGVPVAVSSVTESAPGSYSVVTADFTGGQAIVLTISKQGFEVLKGNTTTAV